MALLVLKVFKVILEPPDPLELQVILALKDR